MNANRDPAVTYPSDYAPPRKYTLVISCVDFRLLDDVVRFLNRDNLTNRYYHLAFAGAALGVAEATVEGPEETPCKKGEPCLPCWGRTLDDHIEIVLKLTAKKLHDVYVIEHRDCGAYAAFLGEEFSDSEEDRQREFELHQKYAGWLQERLVPLFERLKKDGKADRVPRILCFLMGLRGEVERIDCGEVIECEEKPRGRKKGRKKGE